MLFLCKRNGVSPRRHPGMTKEQKNASHFKQIIYLVSYGSKCFRYCLRVWEVGYIIYSRQQNYSWNVSKLPWKWVINSNIFKWILVHTQLVNAKPSANQSCMSLLLCSLATIILHLNWCLGKHLERYYMTYYTVKIKPHTRCFTSRYLWFSRGNETSCMMAGDFLRHKFPTHFKTNQG